MTTEFDYDNFNWSEHFKLDPTSPTGLAWNRESYSFAGRKLETWVGKPAGSLSDVKNKDNKAWRVGFKLNGKNKGFAAHRIIAVLSGMKVNGYVVDHINGVSADNRIENLRVTTQAVNSRNCKPQENSPYGISGVGFQEDRNGNSYFLARWHQDDKRYQESFPIKRLGVMEAFRQAVVCRQKRILELNEKQGAYTERHTKVHDSVRGAEIYKVSREDYAKSFRTNKKRVTNTSGVVGVSFDGTKVTNTSANAFWCEYDENGKQRQKSKSFPVNRYGLLPAFAAACAYREAKIKELNSLGYGYSENHGK